MSNILLLDILRELNESKSIGKIYHYTSMAYFTSIILENSLYASQEMEFKDKNKDYISFISFTRDKNFLKTGKRSLGVRFPYVRIEFDGSGLSSKYKIVPHQFRGIDGKHTPEIGDEQEERLIVPNGREKITDIHKYISEVVIYDKVFNDPMSVKSFLTYTELIKIKDFDDFLKSEKRHTSQEIIDFFNDKKHILEYMFQCKIKIEKL